MTTRDHDLAPSLTDPATIDWPMWLAGIAFFGLLAACVVLWFGKQSQPAPVVRTGTATVNSMGDVVKWDAANVTGIEPRDMIYRDVFKLVPESQRVGARNDFILGMRGKPYSFRATSWNADGDTMRLTFARTDDSAVFMATLTRR